MIFATFATDPAMYPAAAALGTETVGTGFSKTQA